MKNLLITSAVSLVFLLTTCNKPACENTNVVFENYKPTEEPYKAELAKQLVRLDPQMLTYWLDQYIEIEGKKYLVLNVQGDGLCAEIAITSETWPKLEEVITKKGVSYKGAQFLGLSFDLQQNESTEFIYKDIERIVD